MDKRAGDETVATKPDMLALTLVDPGRTRRLLVSSKVIVAHDLECLVVDGAVDDWLSIAVARHGALFEVGCHVWGPSRSYSLTLTRYFYPVGYIEL